MGLEHFNYSNEKNTVVKKYIVPKKIVLTKNANNSEILITDNHRQATLGRANVCILEKGGYVVLDFGAEFQGGVDITVNRIISEHGKTENNTGFYGTLHIVFGESVAETLSDLCGGDNAQNNHSIRDMTTVVSKWSTARYGNTGFRFVKIEAVEGCIEISTVKGAFEYKNIEYKGSFLCNDQRLNKIYDMAAYTVHLNMQDYIWDGIKRDRLVWVGDLHPEVSTICSVFGYDDCVEKSLDLAKESFPISDTDEESIWMSFPSYTCWWIIIHRDWYMQNGRREYLFEQKDYMYKACYNLIKRIDNQGNIYFDGNYFVDWSSTNTPYAEAGFRGCMILALEAATQIFNIYGDAHMGEKCLQAVRNVKKVVPDFSGNKQVSAMVALAGLCSPECANEIITKNLLEGLSTFYGYYVLRALALAGDIQSAIDIMRGYWGAMTDLGATTFWEDFDIAWTKNAGRIDELPNNDNIDIHSTYGRFCYQKLRLSLCHGWAGGPADFIAKHILGVEILEPGCKKVRISPMLGDLEWVKGTYPTPFGVISIEHKRENGKIESVIKAPEGVEIDRG